jgi:2Fe-2S ferredoxin
MPVLTIQPSGKTISFVEGATILETLLAAGEPVEHKCGGKALCGSCHLFVLEGRKGLSKMQRAENERLDAVVGVGSKSRLACQTVLGTEDATVELLSFASGA